MKRLPSFVLKRMRVSQSRTGEHPDADLLTALAEGNLSARERRSVLAHLAACPTCREVMALRSTPQVLPVSSGGATEPKATRWEWRMAAAAAAVCLVVAGVWEIGRPVPLQTVAEPMKPEATAVAKSSPPVLEQSAPKVSLVTSAASQKRKSDLSAKASSARQRAELTKRAEYLAALKLQDQPGQIIAVPEQGAPTAQGIAQFQNQAPLLNKARSFAPRLASKDLVAPLGGSVPSPTADRQMIWDLEASPNDGTIQRSDDGGQTWQTITVDRAATLYAVSASGLTVWVGGGSGKLFHSSDGGSSWSSVQLIYEGALVNDRIVEIDARGGNVKIKTASGATFVTRDGGARWERE